MPTLLAVCPCEQGRASRPCHPENASSRSEEPAPMLNPADRAHQGPWGRTWILAVLLVAAALGGLEGLWRGLGHRPSVVDDRDLWAIQRAEVYGPSLVLVGDSRMQCDVNLDVLRRRLPNYRVVQLAVNGLYPMATLRDLAEDEQFTGVVVCAATAEGFARRRRDRQQPYVDHFHEQLSPSGGVERRCGPGSRNGSWWCSRRWDWTAWRANCSGTGACRVRRT